MMKFREEGLRELGPKTTTVEITKLNDFYVQARSSETKHSWFSDEPEARGGQDKAASPLSFFLSGMGFCQCAHYSEHAIVNGIAMESLTMKISGTFTRQPPRHFTKVAYEVRIVSAESDERIRELARSAADDCFVTNTLKRACEVEGMIYHNGKQIDVHR